MELLEFRISNTPRKIWPPRPWRRCPGQAMGDSGGGRGWGGGRPLNSVAEAYGAAAAVLRPPGPRDRATAKAAGRTCEGREGAVAARGGGPCSRLRRGFDRSAQRLNPRRFSSFSELSAALKTRFSSLNREPSAAPKGCALSAASRVRARGQAPGPAPDLVFEARALFP